MDPFRKNYRELTASEKIAIAGVKATASDMLAALQAAGPQRGIHEGDALVAYNRCMALAREKLEECVMWATKGLTG